MPNRDFCTDRTKVQMSRRFLEIDPENSHTCLMYPCRAFHVFFFQAEDGIRDCLLSRGLGDVYKRQTLDSEGFWWFMLELACIRMSYECISAVFRQIRVLLVWRGVRCFVSSYVGIRIGGVGWHCMEGL